MDWIKDIENYEPYNEQEIKDKDLILKCIKLHDDILTRENTIAHITSSGYIVNKSRTKVLMIYHNIYKSWSWTGGHADGDSNLLHVAIKEAKEETGLKNVTPITENILGLDVLNVNGHVKKGKYNGVKWIPIDELHIHCTEDHIVKTVYSKFNKKIKELNL